MEDHRHCLTSLRSQNNLGTSDLGVVACGIWGELLPNELCQGYPLPSTGTQQLVCCRHRAKAPVECIYEAGDRSTPNRSLGNHGADGRDGVLHAVVQLGEQCALTFPCTFALIQENCRCL